MCGRGAVIENVPEMAAAIRAMNFRARQVVASVRRGLDGAVDGIVEARPAGAAFELDVGLEERLPATGAGEYTGAFFEEKGASARSLRSMATHDLVLLGR